MALTVMAGWAVVRALKLPLDDLEQAAVAVVAGVIIAAWLCLIPALLTSSLEIGIIVSSLIMLGIILILRPGFPRPEGKHILALVAICIISFIFMYMGLLTYFNGEYHVAYPLYGDTAFHSSITSSFSQGLNFPPVYPMMAGQSLHYTFLIDFYSAALDFLGLGLEWCMVLPGWLLLSALLSMLYFVGTRFTGKRMGGALAVILIVLSGGLGFLVAVQDWQASGMTIGDFLANSDLNYTTNWSLNYVFTNFIVIVMAQRTALIGFAAGMLFILTAYVLFAENLGEEKQRKNTLAFLGVIVGLIPMFHTYTYIAIMIAMTLLLLIYKEKKWLYFMVPAIVLALPQALWISEQVSASFFRIEIGWMAKSVLDIPMFWVNNMGFELLLLIAGLFLLSRKNLKFYLPFVAIFIFANIFVTQPWDYDNHKYFSFWLMPSVLVMATTLLYVNDLRKIGKPVFIVFFVLTVLTGALVAVFIIGHPYGEFNKEDIQIGDWIMNNTPKDAVFLTGDSVTDPVMTLAGRKSFLGYGGWLYTHGLTYSDRTNAVMQMYEAADPATTQKLLKNNNIDYVMIGPSELNSNTYYVNKTYFDQNLQCVLNWTGFYGDTYHIYKV
jgi:hypothetical protein